MKTHAFRRLAFSATYLGALGLLMSGLAAQTAAQAGSAAPRRFAVEGGRFTLDGKPVQIISGEMHYPRIPRPYWRERFRMAKAMGLNTITTYVFWNVHEPQPGVYDFSGNLDVAEYIREAQQEGLSVILRPGPYVCAEWEFGGFPAWLLKDPKLVVRSRDEKFLAATSRWFTRLGQEVASLQVGNGGPIIAVQVENEYGSFGDDHAYMEQIRQMLESAGFIKALLYTADGPEELKNGTLPGLPAVINFGPGEAKQGFEQLKQFRPQGPFMTGEFWAGWFDHWGGKHASTDTALQARELEWMLDQGYSVSIYMFHGGTSFGLTSGANDKGTYVPIVTSYDYDAPLDEAGHPTAKYWAFRDVIARYAPVPAERPAARVPAPAFRVPFSQVAPLWTVLGGLGAWHSCDDPVSADELGQVQGLTLYQADLDVHGVDVTGPPALPPVLSVGEVRDRAQVFLNRQPVGVLARDHHDRALPLPFGARGTLELLVEDQGRVDYGPRIGEQKGLIGPVSVDGVPVRGWRIMPLPLGELAPVISALRARPAAEPSSGVAGPAFARATFELPAAADLFLSTAGLGKGIAWVNGFCLGRYWSRGPQRTLYAPGPVTRKGENDLIILELGATAGGAVEFVSGPDLGHTEH